MKIFIHIDMDCYYAQCEAKRLGIDPSRPLCARQWNSLIAINYPARNKGITRGMLTKDAQRLCPEVLLPHVDTFRILDDKVQFSTLSEKFKEHNQNEEKISLQFFRDESKIIFQILRKNFKQIEKGGCDEAYIQLTAEEIKNLSQYPSEFEGVILGCEIQDQQQLLQNYNEDEIKLMQASYLVSLVRKEIYEKTQYRCSAGISFNKMLAKLGSGANKPNNQTLILSRFLPQCIRRGFGGKIQQAFQAKEIHSIAQAQDLSSEELKSIFDGDVELTNFVYQKIYGHDKEELKTVEEIKNKTILSLKNFRTIQQNEKFKLQPIIQLILHDISMRIADYYDDTDYIPSILNLVYINISTGQHQKSTPLSLRLPVLTFKEQIENVLNGLLKQVPEQTLFPINHFGLSVRSFIELKAQSQQFKFKIDEFINQSKEIQKLKDIEDVDILLNPENYYLCDRCEKNILFSEKEEHDNYHFALEIDQQVNPNRKRYQQKQQIQISQTTYQKQQQQNQTVRQEKKKQQQQPNNSLLNYFQLKKQ